MSQGNNLSSYLEALIYKGVAKNQGSCLELTIDVGVNWISHQLFKSMELISYLFFLKA